MMKSAVLVIRQGLWDMVKFLVQIGAVIKENEYADRSANRDDEVIEVYLYICKWKIKALLLL